MDGLLPLWKERGMTSHDCVFKLRKILHTKIKNEMEKRHGRVITFMERTRNDKS